jgi:hypothetical protein
MLRPPPPQQVQGCQVAGEGAQVATCPGQQPGGLPTAQVHLRGGQGTPLDIYSVYVTRPCTHCMGSLHQTSKTRVLTAVVTHRGSCLCLCACMSFGSAAMAVTRVALQLAVHW